MAKLDLTPSESYLLLDINNKDGKTLMKYSLINLLYKRVLVCKNIEETQGTIFKKTVKNTYISKGQSFDKIQLKDHERIFSSPMKNIEEIALIELISKIFEQYNYKDFYELILSMQSRAGFLEIIEERKFFNIFKKRKLSLTDKGMKTKSKIEEIISTGNSDLSKWIENDPPRAKAFINACGANLMLLDKHDLQSLKEYENALKNVDVRKPEDSGFIYWGDAVSTSDNKIETNENESLDSISNEFIGLNAFDSFSGIDSSFDSASGGDSGGCGGGGCGGGCGGCGGGG